MKRSHLVLLSVYLYNEYQGFMQLETLHEAFRKKYPQEKEMLLAITKHAADEKKHYLMFRNYFENQKQMPLDVNEALGYVDLLIANTFGCSISDLNHEAILEDEKVFFRLCRLIMMTEMRGLKQVRWLLQRAFVKNDPALFKIFRVIEKDEPSHYLPYASWLKKNQANTPGWREKLADLGVHYSLMLFRIPFLYLKFWQPRMVKFPYEGRS